MSNQYEENPGRHPDPESDQGPEGTPEGYGEDTAYDATAPHASYQDPAYDVTAHHASYQDPTQPVGSGTGAGGGDQGYGQGYSPGYEPSAVATQTTRRPEPAPRGASWATVAFGLVCVVVAGLALAFQLMDIQVDWEIAGPATVVGLGLLLVLVGVVGLLTRRGDEDD